MLSSPDSSVLTSPGVSDQFATLCVESSSTTPLVQSEQNQQQEHEMSAPDENVTNNNDLSQDRNHSEGSISINLHIDSLEFNAYDLDDVGKKIDGGSDDHDDDDVILGGPADGSTQFKVTPSPYNRRSPSPGAATTDDTEEDGVEILNPPPPTETMAERTARIDAWPLTDIAEPGINDCLFGRGGGTNHHPGNKRYRTIVEDRKETYLTSKRLDKPMIAMDIITEWRGQDPPGRFLKQNDITKLWDDVGDKKAREKTSQALREKTPVKQREGEMEQHSDPRQQNARNARFQAGTTSPVSRHNIKRSALARDHSLGGGEGVLDNEISLEGFSWEESEEPVFLVDDEGNRHVVDDDGNRHGYPPPYHYSQQQQCPGDGYYEQYPPGPGGEYHHHPPAYETQHSLENNSLSDATVTQPAPGSVFVDPYYGHHYPPQPPPGQGYEYPPPPGQGYSPYPPPHNYTSPHQSHHQYHHYSPHNMPPQQQLLTPQNESSYFHPPTPHDGSLPPPPPPPQGYYGGYPSQHGWPTPPGAGPPQAPPGASYHHPVAFDRRYDSLQRNDLSRSCNNGGGNGYYDGQYSGNMPPKSSTPPRRPPTGSSGKAVLREDPASAGSSQDYSKLAELIRDSSDTSSSIDRTTSLVTAGGNSSKEKDVRRTMSMPQESSDRNIVGVVKKDSSVIPPPLDGILRNFNANDGVNRPDTVKRDTSNVPIERSMKRVVLSRDQSEVARRLKEQQQYGAGAGSAKVTKAELLDRKMSVEMNMLGLDDKVLGRVTTEGYLMKEILETTSSIEAVEGRVSTIDEITLEIADGTPPEEWDDTLDLVGLTESDIAEKWLKGET